MKRGVSSCTHFMKDTFACVEDVGGLVRMNVTLAAMVIFVVGVQLSLEVACSIYCLCEMMGYVCLKCYNSSISIRIECPAGHSGVLPALPISLYSMVLQGIAANDLGVSLFPSL